MKRPTHKPWLTEPGYRFSIDWPPGFTPTPGDDNLEARRARAARGRQTALANGHTGTIEGRPLSGRIPANVRAVGEAMVRDAKKGQGA